MRENVTEGMRIVLDEIDALVGDTLLAVLRQLRDERVRSVVAGSKPGRCVLS
jgi:hypothetical protein